MLEMEMYRDILTTTYISFLCTNTARE